MRSARKLSQFPAGSPLLSDDLIEFHAARILLLILICGTKQKIDGLTKLAKLDFFVRYPDFFDKASAAVKSSERSASANTESSMVRYHYGPWDHRYYEVLPFLESCALIRVRKTDSNSYEFLLTALGQETATKLKKDTAFGDLVQQMQQVKKVFGSRTGSRLKSLIYEVFDSEVGQQPLGKVIS